MTDREKLIELLTDDDCPLLYMQGEVGNLADYLISNGVTVRQWIPVTERLPEYCDTCLVLVKYKYDHEKKYNYDTDVATYRSDDGYIDDCWDTYNDWNEGQQDIHVTHWMPMPEAPGKE